MFWQATESNSNNLYYFLGGVFWTPPTNPQQEGKQSLLVHKVFMREPMAPGRINSLCGLTALKLHACAFVSIIYY